MRTSMRRQRGVFDILAVLTLVDRLVALASAALNAIGASKTVSAIIGQRIAEGGRDWTPEERAKVMGELEAARVKADAQIKAAGG